MVYDLVSDFLHCCIVSGETPLIQAARQSHTSTAKYLIEHGANPALASELGATALHHVVGTGIDAFEKQVIKFASRKWKQRYRRCSRHDEFLVKFVNHIMSYSKIPVMPFLDTKELLNF
ncbi:hypothetical protein LXL04_039874 [Taraxacum kok-saghyz]